VRAHERVHLRDFPQTKLDSEINAPFLLNKHGDLYLLLHKNIVYIILLNQEICRKEKKIIDESVLKTVAPTCKL